MRNASVVAMIGAAVAALAFLCAPAHAQQFRSAAPNAPVCANCHESQWHSIDLTAHGAANDANGSMCQACHGDASEHLKDPMKAKPPNPFGKGHTSEERTGVCMTCHQSNRNLAFWTSGKHQLNEVSCSNCHSIHGKSLAPSINKFVTTFLPNQADICANCHQPIRAATMKPSHHPIQEGKVRCTDCHNPHGAITPAMLKQPTINDQCYSCHADKRGPYVHNHPPVEENCATCHNPHGSTNVRMLRIGNWVNETCTGCHAEKRGPFLWDHAPVREACNTCHDPHGSNNDRMLVAKVPMLCQRCHIGTKHPSTIYDATKLDPRSNRLIGRACVNCHSQIHGSNSPAGHAFLR